MPILELKQLMLIMTDAISIGLGAIVFTFAYLWSHSKNEWFKIFFLGSGLYTAILLVFILAMEEFNPPIQALLYIYFGVLNTATLFLLVFYAMIGFYNLFGKEILNLMKEVRKKWR
jgi:hypothetical protein